MTSLPRHHHSFAPRGTLGLIALTCAIFAADLAMPDGLIDGFLYVLVLIQWQRSGSPGRPSLMAGALMLLMILGFMSSPTGVPVWIAVTNRGVAMVTVLVAAFALSRSVREHRRQDSAPEGSARTAADLAQSPNDEPARLTGRLVRDADLELKMLEWRLASLKRQGFAPRDLQTEAFLLGRAVHRTRQSLQVLSLQLTRGDA